MNKDEQITIFVAAPGDVDPERREVAHSVARLNQKLDANIVVYNPDDLLYQSGEDFQSQISQAGVALVITLLWYRAGTPLGKTFNGEDGMVRTGTMFEYENALALKEQTGKPDMLAYRKTADIPAEGIDELDRFKLFWSSHFFDGDSFTGSFKTFKSTSAFAGLIEKEIETWYRQRFNLPYWHLGSPFRGLETFEPEHEAIFFGRDENIKQLSKRLRDNTELADSNNFMLVLGASGSGKSSLIRAGLIPSFIAQGEIFAYVIVSPSQLQSEPLLTFAEILY